MDFNSKKVPTVNLSSIQLEIRLAVSVPCSNNSDPREALLQTSATVTKTRGHEYEGGEQDSHLENRPKAS